MPSCMFEVTEGTSGIAGSISKSNISGASSASGGIFSGIGGNGVNGSSGYLGSPNLLSNNWSEVPFQVLGIPWYLGLEQLACDYAATNPRIPIVNFMELSESIDSDDRLSAEGRFECGNDIIDVPVNAEYFESLDLYFVQAHFIELPLLYSMSTRMFYSVIPNFTTLGLISFEADLTPSTPAPSSSLYHKFFMLLYIETGNNGDRYLASQVFIVEPRADGREDTRHFGPLMMSAHEKEDNLQVSIARNDDFSLILRDDDTANIEFTYNGEQFSKDIPTSVLNDLLRDKLKADPSVYLDLNP